MELTEFTIALHADCVQGNFRFKMLQKWSKSLLQYWQVDGASWPLLQ
jgi:hypothetical protein